MKNTKRERKGFTLLEILLVIAAIGILAAIVLVAINPNRQIAQARNAQRRSDINTIYKALEQYLIDNKAYPTSIDETKKDICISANTPANCITLDELVPTYLSSIPKDPSGGVYKVYKNSENNRIGVEAAGAELGQSIVVNPTSTPAPTIVQNGLVLHLDAGNTSSYSGIGTTWTDLSGNGNNGTLVNGVGFDSVNGGSLGFDGTNEYVDFAAEFNLQPTAGITVSVWFKTTVANTYLINKSSGSGADGYRLFGNANGTMSFAVRSVTATTSSAITAGGWLNVVGTWIPSTSVLIYQNGTQVGSNIDFIPSNINYPAELLEIGRNASGTQGWNGNISQVSVYNRALTATEIQQNYNALKGRFGL